MGSALLTSHIFNHKGQLLRPYIFLTVKVPLNQVTVNVTINVTINVTVNGTVIFTVMLL